MTYCLSEEDPLEDLKVCVQLQCYNLIGIMETCWDSSHNWSIVVGGCKLPRKDRLVLHEGTSLYMRLQQGVYLQMNNELGRADGTGLVGKPHGRQCGRCLTRKKMYMRLSSHNWKSSYVHRPHFL